MSFSENTSYLEIVEAGLQATLLVLWVCRIVLDLPIDVD